MAKVFLSYRHVEPDLTVAGDLFRYLSAKDHQVFLDTRSLHAGDVWDSKIQTNLEKADFFVALVSLAYLHSRYIVEKEWSTAVDLLKAQRLERILLVNLAYDGEPPEAVWEVVEQIQFLKWRSGGDTASVAEEILRLLPPAEVLVRGMRPFDVSDSVIFEQLGRQDDIEHFLSLLALEKPRHIFLHGVSGVGKSSFIQAGLLPHLGERASVVELINLRPELLERLGKAEDIVFLDSFERVLTRGANDPQEGAASFAAVGSWANNPAGPRLVFALRDEHQTPFRIMLPGVARLCMPFPLLPLAPDVAAEVLKHLLDSVHVEYDADLLLLICKELADGVPRTTRPALLQLLAQAFQRRGEKVTKGAWDSLRVHGESLFQDHVRKTVLDRIPTRLGQPRAIRVLGALTHGDFRAPARTVAEIAEEQALAPADVRETLEAAALPHARVVVPEADGGAEMRYSLVHDLFAAAVQSLREKISLEEESRRQVRILSFLSVAVVATALAVFFGLRAFRASQRSDDIVLLRAFEDAMTAGDRTAALLLIQGVRSDDHLPGWRSGAVAALQNLVPIWHAEEQVLGVDPERQQFLTLTRSGRLLVRSTADPARSIELGGAVEVVAGGLDKWLPHTVWSDDGRRLAVSLNAERMGVWNLEAPSSPLLVRQGWPSVQFKGMLVAFAHNHTVEFWSLKDKASFVGRQNVDDSLESFVYAAPQDRYWVLSNGGLWEVSPTSVRKIRDGLLKLDFEPLQGGRILTYIPERRPPWRKRLEVSLPSDPGHTSFAMWLKPKEIFPKAFSAGQAGQFLLVPDGTELWCADLRKPDAQPFDLMPFVHANLPGDAEFYFSELVNVVAASSKLLKVIFVFNLGDPAASFSIPQPSDFKKERLALGPEWLAYSKRLFHFSPPGRAVLLDDSLSKGPELSHIEFDPNGPWLSAQFDDRFLVADPKRPNFFYTLDHLGDSSDLNKSWTKDHALLTWSKEEVRLWGFRNPLGNLAGENMMQFPLDVSTTGNAALLDQTTDRSEWTIQIWQGMPAGRRVTLQFSSPTHEAAMNPAASRVVVVTENPTTITSWDVSLSEKPKLVGKVETVHGASYNPAVDTSHEPASISRRSLRVIAVLEKQLPKIWESDLSHPIAEIPTKKNVFGAFLNASGDHAGLLVSDAIEIWSLKDPVHPRKTVEFSISAGERDGISDLALSDDGKQVVAYGDLFDLLFSPTHSQGVLLRGIASKARSLEISPSGTKILATLYDDTAALWEVSDPDRPLLVMEGFSSPLAYARFGSTENQIVTITSTGWIRTWDISPSGLRKALNDASDLCLTAQQRERYLLESRKEAEKRFRSCESDHGRVVF